ncbi:GTPase [Paraburkholderia sp.]|uniref:GTPase n=1 Tax=Paraburkholderia sp. TaxID=1926495 RepID=UPI00239811CF|nr:GTPase [Paraburkholderia sp.]MDE1180938.1 50S ribosome-binding GTPase [Paraburkholderia sp.]
MSGEIREQATRDVLTVLPNRADDLARLNHLLDGSEPVVTVVGKYNHGKSSLLNELTDPDTFAVSDKRETVTLADSVRLGVRWMDTPGLDADVGTEDDRRALQGVWLTSDIRLFVHAAKEGELEPKELALLAQLRADGERTKRQTVFVLSQVDQLADDTELQKVRDAIAAQIPDIVLNAVSSTRHRKGVEGGKQLMLERSGIPSLHATVQAALQHVPAARTHETAALFDELRDECRQLRAVQERTLDTLRRTQQQQGDAFSRGLKRVIEKVSGDIERMLDALGTDHAVVPDTAKDAYAVTAGKLERAHIQIAYSRACIEIESFLAGHGAVDLPPEQQVASSSLNSVMIAVMGVSVKFRKNLREMFCAASGRERMQRDFTRYYELSADRQLLASRIREMESAGVASEQASIALRTLEAAV